jgi:hypothetical protein
MEEMLSEGVEVIMSVIAEFRKHPELEPTGKLSLLGEASCSADQMNSYAKRRNIRAPEVAELYLRLGQCYGIRGDVAYCQMVYETRGWTAELSGPSWAPFTLAQWSEESSIALQMQILYTFATNLALPQQLNTAKRSIALLERAGWRGNVQCWEDLNGKWSVAGNPYGQDIVAIWRNMKEWISKGEVLKGNPNGRMAPLSGSNKRERISGSVDWSSFCSEEMKWLKEQLLLPNPVPHPDRQVTWAELAALLYQWENRSSTATMEGKVVSSKKEG